MKKKNKNTTSKERLFNQYPVDLLNFLEAYLESSKYLKMGKFVPVGAICEGNLKVNLPVYVREMSIHFHSTTITYILAHVSTSL